MLWRDHSYARLRAVWVITQRRCTAANYDIESLWVYGFLAGAYLGKSLDEEILPHRRVVEGCARNNDQ
jgi:hypothetical protein